MREIDKVCELPFTGIVNNSNLGDLTDEDCVRRSFEEAQKLSDLSQMPIRFTSVCDKLTDRFRGDAFFPIHLQSKFF